MPTSQWEYIMVDSGSDRPLKECMDVSWHPNAVIVEAPYKALVRSRLKGMELARSPLIIFVDDDNVLDPDYLERAVALMHDYPFIGALGAYCEGEFEVPVEPWMHEFLCILSAMQFDEKRKAPLQYALTKEGGSWIPAGNGMVLRKAVADIYRQRVAQDARWLEIGRVGTSLMGSDDTDLVFTSIDAGFAIGTSSRLHMTHLIPARRLTPGYLARLLYSSNYASNRMAVERGWRKKEPMGKPTLGYQLRTWLGKLRKRTHYEECWIASIRGTRDGRALATFDERYR